MPGGSRRGARSDRGGRPVLRRISPSAITCSRGRACRRAASRTRGCRPRSRRGRSRPNPCLRHLRARSSGQSTPSVWLSAPPVSIARCAALTPSRRDGHAPGSEDRRAGVADHRQVTGGARLAREDRTGHPGVVGLRVAARDRRRIMAVEAELLGRDLVLAQCAVGELDDLRRTRRCSARRCRIERRRGARGAVPRPRARRPSLDR